MLLLPWTHPPRQRRLCVLALVAAYTSFSAVSQTPTEDAFQALLRQGFELHQQARFSEAVPILQRARKLEPDDYFANLLLGIDLLRIGKPAEAAPRLKLAAQVKPSEEFPEDYLGEAEAALGEQALAAEAYLRAVTRGHDSEGALEAWAGFALERFRQIGEELRASQSGLEVARRLQKAAASPESTLASGSSPASGCATSIPALERELALKTARMDADATYRLSVCYALEAGQAAERLQASASDMVAVHRLRGDVLLRLKGDATAAEGEYRQAIAVRPGDPGLLERLAEAQLSAGDLEGSGQSAQAALTADPHSRAALRTLAALAMSNRNYDEALPWLRELAAQAPGDRSTQVELGRALAKTDDWKAALQSLAPALAAGYPDEKGSLHALLAQVLRKLGRDSEAARADSEARRLSDAYQAHGAANETHPQSGNAANHESPDAN